MKNNHLKQLIFWAYEKSNKKEIIGIIYTKYNKYELKDIKNIKIFLFLHKPELIYLKSIKTNVEAGLYNGDIKNIRETDNSIQIDLICNKRLIFGY